MTELVLDAEARAQLQRLEEELWREETRFDRARGEELFAPDFFEFGRSGRYYRRDDTLAAERAPIRAVLPLPEFAARLLAPDVAQVTYRSVVRYGDEVQYGRRSSLWTRVPDGEGWVLRFHQGTPTEPPFAVWSEPVRAPDDALRFVEKGFELEKRAFLLDGALLPAEFFTLRSRFAGEFAQKLVNYRVRVGVVLPPDPSRGERFAEFVRELSRHPSFRAFASRADAEAWLASV